MRRCILETAGSSGSTMSLPSRRPTVMYAVSSRLRNSHDLPPDWIRSLMAKVYHAPATMRCKSNPGPGRLHSGSTSARPDCGGALKTWYEVGGQRPEKPMECESVHYLWSLTAKLRCTFENQWRSPNEKAISLMPAANQRAGFRLPLTGPLCRRRGQPSLPVLRWRGRVPRTQVQSARRQDR